MQAIRRRSLALGLIALAAPGITARPAAAQTFLNLFSGDAVTVSGTGTAGTIGGIPVASTVTDYTDGDAPPGYDIGTFGNAAFTLVSGGTLGASPVGLDAFGSGPVAVAGGTIDVQNGGYGVFSRGAGGVTVSSGTISAQIALYTTQGTINVTGGTLRSTILSGAGLYAAGGIIDVFGTGFTYAPFGAAPRPITSGPLAGSGGTLTGTLLNGQTLSTIYRVVSGSIVVNVGPAPAPEPSQAATLGLGTLGLVGMVLKACRRKSLTT